MIKAPQLYLKLLNKCFLSTRPPSNNIHVTFHFAMLPNQQTESGDTIHTNNRKSTAMPAHNQFNQMKHFYGQQPERPTFGGHTVPPFVSHSSVDFETSERSNLIDMPGKISTLNLKSMKFFLPSNAACEMTTM